MADLSLEISVSAKKKDAETFGQQIAEGMKKSLGKLGIVGSAIGKTASGGEGGNALLGILGKVGLIAGGVLAMAGILGIFEPTIKLLKLILMLFFLPALPFFVLALKGLAKLVDAMAPGAVRGMEKSQAWIDETIFNFKEMGRIWKERFLWFIEQIRDSLEPIAKILKPIISSVIDGIKSSLSAIADVFKRIYEVFVAGYNKVASFVGMAQISAGGGGGGGGSSANTGFGTSGKDVFGIPYNFPFGGVTGKQLGGVISQNRMFGLHRGERVLSATERGPSMGGGGGISVTINNPQVRRDEDIKLIVREMDSYLKRELRRRVSYI